MKFCISSFNIVNEWGEIVINWTKCLLDTKVHNTLDVCWQMLLNKLQCTKTTSTDSNFGASSLYLPWPTSFLVPPYNSNDNNSNL